MLTEKDLFFRNGQRRKRMPCRREDAARITDELLLALGIAPHLGGFEPLSEEVRITAERRRGNARPPITDPEPIAVRLCGEHGAEHAMRDAIGVGFLHTDEIHTRIFPYTDRPGCAEFICTLAELVLDRITQQ